MHLVRVQRMSLQFIFITHNMTFVFNYNILYSFFSSNQTIFIKPSYYIHIIFHYTNLIDYKQQYLY